MGPDDQTHDLTALTARVLASLPASARRADGEWDVQEVSKSLHSLHESIQQQLRAQEAELDHAQTQIVSLRATAHEESRGMQREVEATALEIDQIKAIVESSEVHFSELVALLEPKTHQLQVLDARRQYLETAMEVERRSQEAKACALQATAAALDAFQAFSLFVQTIPSAYVALRREAMRRVEELSYGIKLYAVQKLQTALEAIEWPRSLTMEELVVTENVKMVAVAQAFAYLLTLHVSQLQADTMTENKSADTTKNTVELWALECLLEPIRLRFRFHFERNESKTNRITKPEWFLSHVVEQTRAHRGFLSRIITPQLHTHRESLDCVDANVLFLRGLIQTASKKLSRDVAMALSDRAVFCHTIDEVLLFEQAVDDEFNYGSYAASQPLQFPRVVDVLTEDPSTLLAWTKIDLEYAKETLENSIFKDTSTTFAWSCSSSSSTTMIPAAAQQFVALLDFLCRRFAHLSQESHRYVYLSQVHFVLLQEFHRACTKRAHKLNAESLDQTSLVGVLGVVNSAQHVVDVLEAWDESPFFIELLRKVAESDKSRTQILKMHLESSKLLLKNAARAATHTIMAREEAMAVHQAIAGPGAMIGPTAAFSAAYSVGSKTVKSLFGRSDDSETTAAVAAQVDQPVAAPDGELLAAKHETETAAAMDAETLLFSRTVFEQFVREYKSLVAMLVADIRDAVLRAFKRALYAYRTSPHWVSKTTTIAVGSTPELVVLPEISSELGSATALLHRVLTQAHDLLLSEETFSQLWKPLVASLDDAIFSAASSVLKATASSTGHGIRCSNPRSSSSISGFSLTSAATAIGAVESSSSSSSSVIGSTDQRAQAWSPSARAQFIVDVDAVASVFQQVSAKNPRAYLRKSFDLCRVIEMPTPRLREIHEALRGDDGDAVNAGSSMEQLTTILEACNILTLTPHQVQTFCEHQLGLQ